MNVIGEATADFVLATRDRFAMALDVEAAMAGVRMRLALAFLNALEGCLRVGMRELPGDGWSVATAASGGADMMARHAYVSLRRENWPVMPGDEEADFHCICLQADKPNWVAPWIGIYASPAEAELTHRLAQAAAHAVGECQADETWVAYRRLEPPLDDWRQRAFLLDAGYPALEQGAEAEAVRDLGQQMLALARAAAPIYDQFLSSTSRGAA